MCVRPSLAAAMRMAVVVFTIQLLRSGAARAPVTSARLMTSHGVPAAAAAAAGERTAKAGVTAAVMTRVVILAETGLQAVAAAQASAGVGSTAAASVGETNSVSESWSGRRMSQGAEAEEGAMSGTLLLCASE